MMFRLNNAGSIFLARRWRGQYQRLRHGDQEVALPSRFCDVGAENDLRPAAVDGREDGELRVRPLDPDPFFAAIGEIAKQLFYQAIAHAGAVAFDSQLNPAQRMEAHEGLEIR